MKSLMANMIKNKKAGVKANAQKNKNLVSKNKIAIKKENIKQSIAVEKEIMKESKTLMID